MASSHFITIRESRYKMSPEKFIKYVRIGFLIKLSLLSENLSGVFYDYFRTIYWFTCKTKQFPLFIPSVSWFVILNDESLT